MRATAVVSSFSSNIDTIIMALHESGAAGRLALLQAPATANQTCMAVQQNISKDIVAKFCIADIGNAELGKLGLSNVCNQIVPNVKVLSL